MRLSQIDAIKMALETCRIVKTGSYDDAAGASHNIRFACDDARKGTRLYAADWEPAALPAPVGSMQIEVTSETTLKAARRLYEEGGNVVALNFANAHQPGGGFLLGAPAQEESLCRSSGLYHCLRGQLFYRQHLKNRAPRHSCAALYSPGVPVIRDEELHLAQPWPLAFITAAAPNVRFQALPPDELRVLFHERITKVLSIAVENGHDQIVLGAWGCGAFGNDAVLVADVFAEVLHTAFEGRFTRVVFAIKRNSKDPANFEAFRERFQREGCLEECY